MTAHQRFLARKVLTAICFLSLFMAGLALVPRPASAQIVWKPTEDVKFNFGFQGQMWGDSTQNAETGGYAQNLYLRRTRLIVGGEIGSNVTFFFETDDPNLGKTPKALNTGFLVQDAFLEWKLTNAFRLDGGIMLVPFSHNGLQSTVTYLTLDVSPLATVSNISTQSSALRDTGFQARGFLFNDHLLYRVGVFQGDRNTDARNSLRSAAYVQYDFFGSETSYVMPGTTLGRTRLLGISAGADTQGSYRAYSAGMHGALPVLGGDELGGQVEYLHYDGRKEFIAIPDQRGYLTEAAYYIHKIKLQPFGKAESTGFNLATAALTKDYNRYGCGANYYVHGQNLKLTAQYLRAEPRHSNSGLKSTNEFTLQLQVFYF